MTNRAVVLLSGGLDSGVTLAIAQEDGNELYALTFDYGQKHAKEVESAKKLAEYYKVKKHMILRIPLEEIAESSLTTEEAPIPEDRTVEEMTITIPSTYVPGRNIVLLSYALSWAETVHADTIYIGTHTQDYSGYPDCRPEFLRAFQNVSALGTRRGAEGREIELKYPIIDMTKAQIVARGAELKVPFELTWSCYKGGEKACGVCDSCKFRLTGFKELGLEDPLEYEAHEDM
ncbi:MAG: 7-cyano-7-deazaguanine synthase QueC [Methanobacteriota archaeon]|nr:MAG: 7-cyano-7-deazaguanine synthase QueC [Euryarchaeota archaeon]